MEEFLGIPSLMTLAFLLAAAGVSFLDRQVPVALQPFRSVLESRFFPDYQDTETFLNTVAAGMMTVTSITISMLLVVLQQSATNLSDQVFDQFIHRRRNQAYFGYFVGVTLFSLFTLATVGEAFNPIFGASLSLILSALAVYLLVWLLYTTINQMRPEVIVEAVHQNTLQARERQLPLMQRTRRRSQYQGPVCLPVRAPRHGFVTAIDVSKIGEICQRTRGEVEVTLYVTMGSYAAYHDIIAEIQAENRRDAEQVGQIVQSSIRFERQREIYFDPAYGIEQLEMIAWTSISTSKSNPEPGLLTIRCLRDVLARWLEAEDTDHHHEQLPVVYQDNVYARVLDTFESLAVVSSESMQHQNFTEVIRSMATLFGRMPPDLQDRTEDLLLRCLSAMADHVLTGPLDATLSVLVQTLQEAGRTKTAWSVQAAQGKLRQSVGKLHSRSSRDGQ
jgi:uncharacterized membrane protein